MNLISNCQPGMSREFDTVNDVALRVAHARSRGKVPLEAAFTTKPWPVGLSLVL